MDLCKSVIFPTLFLLSPLAVAFADSIVLNGDAIHDVYVTEGTEFYVVLYPETGEMENIPKDTLAPEDVSIAEDADARIELYQQWRKARGITKPKSTANEPESRLQETAPEEQLESFKYKKALFETAEFEAGLEHWASLPASIRQMLVDKIYREQGATDQFFGSRISSFHSSRSANNQAIENNAEVIGEHASEISRHNAEEAREVNKAYSNSSLRYYEGMYESSYFRREAQLANGYYNPYTDITVDQYYLLYDNELGKANSRAAAANARHSAARASHESAISRSQRAIGNLNQANRRINYLERNAGIASTQLAVRANSRIAEMEAFEFALANEYSPYLRRTEVLAFGTSDGRTEAYISIPTNVWRIDFQSWGAPGFYVDLFDAATDKPITRLDDNALPHERFQVFDEPGHFRFVAHVPRDGGFEIHVYEVYD